MLLIPASPRMDAVDAPMPAMSVKLAIAARLTAVVSWALARQLPAGPRNAGWATSP